MSRESMLPEERGERLVAFPSSFGLTFLFVQEKRKLQNQTFHCRRRGGRKEPKAYYPIKYALF